MKHAKRTLQVNVRLSQEALELMRQAAQQSWPDVPLSNSTLLLTLAQKQALEILDGVPPANKTKSRAR